MRVLTGTSGFSYKEWRGDFYPEKIKPGEMLAYYATRLRTVEINNTFYRLPRASVLSGWAEQVDDGFRFVIKASRRITHFKRLKPESLDETRYLVDTLSVLESRLGVVLMQLPPNFPRDTGRLASFLDEAPPGVQMAFEFRHPSWLEDEVFEVLGRHGHALCFADADNDLEVPLVRTADWGYLRLRRNGYTDEEIGRWAETVRSMNWREAYVFFKHEDDAGGPLMAEAFAGLFAV